MRQSYKPAITLAGFACLLSAVAIPAQAASTLTVIGTGEPAALTTNDCSGTQCVTLRGAINAAASGDTIVFDKAALDGQTIILTLSSNALPTGTEFGPSAFFLTNGKSLTIDATANGLTQGVVLARSGAAGTANFRLFDVANGSSLSLRGLTLRNGLAQGGVSHDGGGALGAGGAIFNQGTLVLQQCTLAGNVAQGGATDFLGKSGGAGVGESSATATGGGPNGGFLGGSYPGGSGLPGNSGGFGGGGGAGGATLGDNNGDGSTGGNGGKGGFGGGGGKGGDAPHYAFLVESAGNGGQGGFGGGGGRNGYGLEFNSVPGGFGGGSGSDSSSGGGGGMGGAIFNDAGTVTLTNVTLAENRARGGGTGYAGKSGSGFGGAIFNYAGSLSLSFVTASDNLVAAGPTGAGGGAAGGAIFSLSDTLANCSAGGNSCPTAGTATLTISNSIAANSTGTVSDIVSHTSYADTSVYVPSAATLSGPVKLGTLPSPLHGGLVDVMIPPAGSSAINAGGAGPCTVGADQRGVSRPQGAVCDIGAVEVDTIFASEFETVALAPLVQCTGMNNHTDVLIDTFAGPALGTDWTQNNNGGTVTVSDGVSVASSAATTPFITSALPIIPAAGDFSVRWNAQYTNYAGQGTGTLVLSNGLPANGASDNYALRSADTWQDSNNGFFVRARTDAATYSSVFTELPVQNGARDIEYCWIGSQNTIEVWVDGTRLLQAPNTSLTRPTSLWFGNPVIAGAVPWSSFTLDHVYVRSVSP